MKVVAIVQARMGSTRLPGKVMMDLGGHPTLAWCVRAAQAAPGVDQVWVATSTLPADDEIAAWCDGLDHDAWSNIPCYRGSETDVLDRFFGAAEAASADVVLRLTGDCPFLDPKVVGDVVRLYKTVGVDYCSNISPRTYPDGLDVQLMSRFALEYAWLKATRPFDRDAVCSFIERNGERFPAQTLINPTPGMQDERWVLDTEKDLQFCRAIVERWPWEKGPPSMLDIASILDEEPDIRAINAGAICNERAFAALADEIEAANQDLITQLSNNRDIRAAIDIDVARRVLKSCEHACAALREAK